MKILPHTVLIVLFICNASTAQACGKERWLVKVGKDKDAAKVTTEIKQTNVAELIAIGAPINPNIRRDSRYAPAETTLYQISGRLVVIKREADQDYHLVIQDNKGRTMIVESPAGSCAKGSRFEKEISQVHRQLNAKYHIRSKKKKPNDLVTVTGIGFFDKIHGQEGVAPNGIELHPILAITFNK